MKHTLLLLFLILSCLGSGFSHADKHQDKLLCAITEVIDCGRLGECVLLLPGQANLPDFITIDLKSNKITGHNRDHSEEIRHEKTVDNNIILQGVSGNGRGWSLLISDDRATISGAAVGDEYTFSFFGACKPQ